MLQCVYFWFLTFLTRTKDAIFLIISLADTESAIYPVLTCLYFVPLQSTPIRNIKVNQLNDM